MSPNAILAGARTVTHLATYFEELKQTVAEMRRTFGSRARGYFTPTEDEEVRHLLVAYCQSRNALLELVSAYRDDLQLDDSDRPAAFLVAFAAAALLVDAARYLRDSFDQTPVVRDKLNEPEPHFGIPAGTYDMVQASLTSPRHAWHLYHAMQYFDENESLLRERGRQEELAPALQVIDRLGQRVRVPASRYAQARVRVRASQALSGLKSGLVGKALYGLQKIGSSMMSGVFTRPGHSPDLPSPVRDEVCRFLQPGDVVITRKEYAVTNYFLPGYWPHAALYLGDAPALTRLGLNEHANVRPRWARIANNDPAEPGCVLEAMKDGVLLRTRRSPLQADSLVVLRPRLPAEGVALALARGLFHEGKPYDFDFDFTRSDRLVCTEVVYRSYEGIGGLQFELKRRAGRLTLSADDLLQMALSGNGFDLAAAYVSQHAERLLIGSDVLAAVEAARRRTPLTQN